MKKFHFILAACAIASLLTPSCCKHDPAEGQNPETPGEESRILSEEYHPSGVDMGGSVLWAEFNLGATADVQLGYSLQWAAWEPDGESPYYDEQNMSFTAYNATDGLNTLRDQDDATVILLGDGWHVPSPDDYEWLIENCNWEFTANETEKIYGLTATSTINGNQLFFPIYYPREDALTAPVSIMLMGASVYYMTNALYSNINNVAFKLGYGGILSDNPIIHKRTSLSRRGTQCVRPVLRKPISIVG